MERTVGRRIVKRFGCYFVFIVLGAAMIGMESYRQSNPIYQNIPIQDKAVDSFLEMNRLLTTLATTLLGAVGFLVLGGTKGKHRFRELWAASAGAIFVGLSIYYGYAAYSTVESMVAGGNFDPYSPPLLTVAHLHFYTFLVGIILFAGFVYQNITEDGHEHSDDVIPS
jgi:hypothetical protein